MGVERDVDWEVEEVLEEEGVRLEEMRRRRKSEDAVEAPMEVEEEKSVEGGGGGGGEAEQSIVYFATDQAQNMVPVEIAGMKPIKNDEIAPQGKLANGKSNFKCEIINDQKDVPNEEANNVLKKMKMESGSNSERYSETQGGENEIAENEDEKAVHEQILVVKRSKLKMAEFDLERILEEQDTHDLYCPNCNSCITRRVVLRKRKRIVREDQPDKPAKKIHEEQGDAAKLDSVAVSGEMTNLIDTQEPDVFRCLSCFSFFIPIDGGFNIFRLFDKGKETRVQSSGQVPEKKINRISSIFKLDISKRNGSEPDSKPNEPYTVARGVDQSKQKENEQSPPTVIPGALKFEETQITSQTNTPDILVSGPSSVSFEEHLEDPSKKYDPVTQITFTSGAPAQIKELVDAGVDDVRMRIDEGVDTIQITSQIDQIIHGSEAVATGMLAQTDIRIDVAEQTVRDTDMNNIGWDVLKSMVYGGLTESITSLGVVSSAAGSGASTLNIVALGLANVIGGFFVITHDLFELRTAQDESTEQIREERAGRYWQLLGRRTNFRLHFLVAITSYILCGLLPPVVYGFSFRRSDNREYKLIAVAAASLLCTALLATGKAHVMPQKAYMKTLLYYLGLAAPASGVSYVAGVMVGRLFEQLGLFDRGTAPPSPPALMYQGLSSRAPPAWASY